MFEILETSTNDWVFGVAEQGLTHLGPQDKAYAPRLLAGITNAPNIAAIVALGQIGPDAKQAIPRLKSLLQYRSEDSAAYEEAHGSLDPWTVSVRKAVQEAIPKIEPPASPPH
jgi:hypothetical protein